MDNLSDRFAKILQRYGISGNSLRQNIRAFVETANRYQAVPTFPTTAQVLARHRKFFQDFDPEQVEFAIHGYYHQDYTMLATASQKEQMIRALFTFQENNIPVHGFRFPYLRVNHQVLGILNDMPLIYDSSFPFWWPVALPQDQDGTQVLQKMEEQYTPFSPAEKFTLPYFIGKLVELPVSLPDDDILVDRVNQLSLRDIFSFWLTILQQTMERGDLFILQLHPERFEILKPVLTDLLAEVQRNSTHVWMAPLREIARWWKVRRQVLVEYDILENNRIKLHLKRPVELEYECLNYHVQLQVKIVGMLKSEFNFEEIILPISRIPLIGVSRQVSREFKEMLFNLGFYYVENPPEWERFSVYFDKDPVVISEIKWLEDFLEHLDQPLMRFHLWPGSHRSAFAVTGDIDAITAQDFFSRVYGR
jgi:peptidoglycan/xylan/chitin deacetylase (PgdA/CDA1 family)